MGNSPQCPIIQEEGVHLPAGHPGSLENKGGKKCKERLGQREERKPRKENCKKRGEKCKESLFAKNGKKGAWREKKNFVTKYSK